MTDCPPAPRFHVRWMQRDDLGAVLACERAACRSPGDWTPGTFKEDCWQEEHYDHFLRHEDAGVLVAVAGGEVVAHLAFVSYERVHHLLSLCVREGYRRRGCGRKLLRGMARLPARSSRDHAVALVRETDLRAQLFFKACGFHCQEVNATGFSCPDEAGLLFVWDRPHAA